MSFNVKSMASVALRAKLTNDANKKTAATDKIKNKFEEAHKARISAFVKQPQDALNKKFRETLLRKARKAKGRIGGVAKLSEQHHEEMKQISNFYETERKLGPISRFGDGDGSWWDRWLAAPAAQKSSFSSGYALPQAGFKQRRPNRHCVAVVEGQFENDEEVTVRVQEKTTWREAAGLKGVASSETPAQKRRRELLERRQHELDVKQRAEAAIRKREIERQKREKHIVFNFQTEYAKNKANAFELMVTNSTNRLLEKLSAMS